MILVTGASGHVGGELVAALADQGRPVRALVRDPASFEAPHGVQTAGGDLNDPESLADALAGVDGVFLLGGFADMSGVLARARAAGVGHVVLLSSRSVVGGNPDNAVAGMHLASEAAVRESGIGWTLLRPSGFMSNTFEWVPQLREGDVVTAPFAGVPIAAIDPRDIAAVAAAVLTRREHHGRSHAMTGPAALLPADRAEILGRVLGRPVSLRAQPDDEARAEMSRTIPAKYVDAFFRFFVDGEFDDSSVLSTVQEITGRPARGFEDWAVAHRARFE
ncbi:NAD(P)H-binding protein [Solihabitans fulvus]|uniref:NAD(P)H-binding protein n=1 Tax=Solihabitans fulvus TaxID=1892852 RepID=A0A5B2XBA6_9PSEU|nr:NAD(P)H-binding protein [Solihabitans fulvus]KAA2260435.1 NAD(P)H-binding protein [Solihabitans fulvus]